MTNPALERLKKFHEYVLELGLAQAILALPAPRMLALEAPSTEASSAIFAKSITEKEILNVSRDLFVSGHYSLSVQESYKALEKYIKEAVFENEKSGANLINYVFSINNPIIKWSELNTTSEQDEQKGYHFLYLGAMLGIRNPVTHEFNWVEDEYTALELIVFAQHLLRKAKKGKVAI